jgi:DNA-binding LacI/PurR family transcriptional regulator
MDGQREIRLEDVARLAHVSRATASRALSGGPGASPESVAAVRSAATRLGYRINPVARALALGSATPDVPTTGGRVVIAVVGESRDVLRDGYVATAAASVAEVAGEHGAGVGLEWLPLNGSRALHRLAVDPGVRGVILVNTVDALLSDIPRPLRGRVVSIGVGSVDVPHLDVDNGGAARTLLGHLLAAGRQRIVLLSGPTWMPCLRRQTGTYHEVLAGHGLPPRVVAAGFSSAGGAAAMAEALEQWPDLDAVMATCDSTAAGALRTLRGRGVRVPDDVAVTGFDDLPLAAELAPALTTATHPVALIAATAATHVLEPSARDRLPHLFGSELVLRESA